MVGDGNSFQLLTAEDKTVNLTGGEIQTVQRRFEKAAAAEFCFVKAHIFSFPQAENCRRTVAAVESDRFQGAVGEIPHFAAAVLQINIFQHCRNGAQTG